MVAQTSKEKKTPPNLQEGKMNSLWKTRCMGILTLQGARGCDYQVLCVTKVLVERVFTDHTGCSTGTSKYILEVQPLYLGKAYANPEFKKSSKRNILI